MVLGSTNPSQVLTANPIHKGTITASSYLSDMKPTDLKLTDGYLIDQHVPSPSSYLPESLPKNLYELLIVRVQFIPLEFAISSNTIHHAFRIFFPFVYLSDLVENSVDYFVFSHQHLLALCELLANGNLLGFLPLQNGLELLTVAPQFFDFFLHFLNLQSGQLLMVHLLYLRADSKLERSSRFTNLRINFEGYLSLAIEHQQREAFLEEGQHFSWVCKEEFHVFVAIDVGLVDLCRIFSIG